MWWPGEAKETRLYRNCKSEIRSGIISVLSTTYPDYNRNLGNFYNMENLNKSSQTRFNSFKLALSGLSHAFSTQKNFQIQLVIGIIVVTSAWVLGFSRIEWLILITTINIVLAAELLNTVIEVVIDLAVKEKLLPDAKIAKDVAAAAVLLIAVFSVMVGLILFVPHLI